MSEKEYKTENNDVNDVVEYNDGFDENDNNLNEHETQPQKKPSTIENVFEWLDSIVVSLCIVIFVFTVLLGKVEVSGKSMMDTLKNGDQLIITGYNYTPKRGDIVIISRNSSNTEEGKLYADKPLVKRIVALGGQTVEIKDGYLYVDGEKQIESYAKTMTEDNGFIGKQTVPEGYVFVLGDNRGDSADSRIIGFIDENYILGKVLCRIFPFDSVTTF